MGCYQRGSLGFEHREAKKAHRLVSFSWVGKFGLPRSKGLYGVFSASLLLSTLAMLICSTCRGSMQLSFAYGKPWPPMPETVCLSGFETVATGWPSRATRSDHFPFFVGFMMQMMRYSHVSFCRENATNATLVPFWFFQFSDFSELPYVLTCDRQVDSIEETGLFCSLGFFQFFHYFRTKRRGGGSFRVGFPEVSLWFPLGFDMVWG